MSGTITLIGAGELMAAESGLHRAALARRCLDHLIPLSDRQLRRVVTEYATYDNAPRPHRTLALETPEGPHTVQREGVVAAIPALGGLHHRYQRVAA